ncbi:MAG: CotH kinase family protein, partial [Muribaculaceae bacterium]|nr:CotH kinase family protein [Muribaculaceae bacterium]
MKRFFISALLSLMAVMALNAQVFLCGAVNDWNIDNVLEFSKNSDGVYVLKVNFSKGPEFKISTVRPASQGTSAWTEFDSGVLGMNAESTVANQWMQLMPGKVQNIKAPSTGEYTLMVDLATNRLMFSDGLEVPPVTGAWSGTLPVLFVNTTDNLPVDSKETYRTGTYYLDPMGVEGVEAIGSEEAPLSLQIKGRGNYTWTGFDKKPYRLKLDAKAPLMGMKRSKHFALLAHADDNLGFMRNEMGFALSRIMGLSWTPSTRPVEVVLNGDYIGLYWLTETIRVDADRVNVVEQEDNATDDVDGGWLVEIDNYDTDPHVTVNTSDDYPIWFTYKSPEILSSEQELFLQSQMSAINDAVQSFNFTELAKLVDIDCLARYYIVQQLMQDRESFHGSCYLYRERGADARWMFGPVWDFGNAFSDN